MRILLTSVSFRLRIKGVLCLVPFSRIFVFFDSHVMAMTLGVLFSTRIEVQPEEMRKSLV